MHFTNKIDQIRLECLYVLTAFPFSLEKGNTISVKQRSCMNHNIENVHKSSENVVSPKMPMKIGV